MIILTEFQCKVLLKLRRDSAMTYSEMEAHWGNLTGLQAMMDDGYVNIQGGIVSITAQGRAHDVALNLQRLQNELPAKVKIDAPMRLSSTLPHAVLDASKTPDSWAEKMLAYIEQHPGCRMNSIGKDLGHRTLTDGYIRGYITRGEVLVYKNEQNKTVYRLADNLTAAGLMAAKHTKYGEAKVVKPAQVVPEKSASVEYEIPAFLNTNKLNDAVPAEAPAPTDEQVAATLALFPTLASAPPSTRPSTSGDFRCAYTNDGCLMLLGLQCLPIELNAAQTNDLIEFISEQIMPIGVAL